MDNFKEYGVEVSDVKMVLPQMMKQKDKAVAGLTSGIEGLFKKNKVNTNWNLLSDYNLPVDVFLNTSNTC